MVILRAATPNDIPAIARIHVDTWRTTYRGIMPDELLATLSYKKREQSWHQIMGGASEDGNFTYVAEEGPGRVVGFANGGVERTGDPVFRGELYAIYVLQPCQHQGIGRALMGAIAARLRRMQLDSMLVWVLADNPACQFYEALGGQIIRTRAIIRADRTLIEIAYGWSAPLT